MTEMAYLSGQYDLAVEVSQSCAKARRWSVVIVCSSNWTRWLPRRRCMALMSKAQWEAVLRWADAGATADQDRGLVYQRYGTVLAYRDDLDGAERLTSPPPALSLRRQTGKNKPLAHCFPNGAPSSCWAILGRQRMT